MNIACALRCGVASIEITLLGVTHLILDNILQCCMSCRMVFGRASSTKRTFSGIVK